MFPIPKILRPDILHYSFFNISFMQEYSNFPFSPESIENELQEFFEKEYPGFSKRKRLTIELSIYRQYGKWFPLWVVKLILFRKRFNSISILIFFTCIFLFIAILILLLKLMLLWQQLK